MASKTAEVYQQHHQQGGRLGTTVHEARRTELFKGWIGTGKDVVDLGCRDGRLAHNYAEGNRLLGCDIDSNSLQRASEMFGMKVKQIDLNMQLPFSDDSFDVAVLGEVLEHLPYPWETLGEIRRILRCGGILVGSVPLAYHMSDRFRVLKGKRLRSASDPTHLRFFSYNMLLEQFAAFFEVQNIIALDGSPFWLRFSQRLFAKRVAFRCRKTQ
jgi:SAM-dependent methyltransferase